MEDGSGESSEGQYDDLFDSVGDKSSVGQFDDLFEVQEPTEEENEKNGELGGQSGRLFDNTGENVADGQFDGLVDGTGKGENTAATLQDFNELNEFLNNTIGNSNLEGQSGIFFDNTGENVDGTGTGGTGENTAGTLQEERGCLNELNKFLNNTIIGNSGRDADEQQHVQELSLYEWVGRKSKMQCYQVMKYSKVALPVALKLTDFLIDAEKGGKDGHGNPVPLGSIVAENVLIRTKQLNAATEGGDQQDVIEYVWIMSSIGENPDTGTVNTRLFALGNVLYKLFAGNETDSSLDGMPAHDSTYVECNGVPTQEEDGYHRPTKRSQMYSEDTSSNCIARLQAKGLPYSVRTLVKNLLDCGKWEYFDEDNSAYSSFYDLKQDLSLMLADPSRFLDDIQVSNGLPTLEICDKLYGREKEVTKLVQLYKQHINSKKFKGVIISGGAGVGKSRLAMHIQKLTTEANGYFYATKFQQNSMQAKPLSTIGALFNSLCDRFAKDAAPLQLKLVSDELANSLGSQAGLLSAVVPSLSKLMPLSLEETPNACVDAPSSMRYLFGELLRVVSSHSSRPISLFIDDIQFADSASLLLIFDLLFSAARSDSSVFFAFCHRDDDPNIDSEIFNVWLSSISMYSLEELKLDNMNVEGVNSLISDSLHLSPRITRPLSTVLHHQTMGNPLFVRQLLVSLKGQGYIFVNLSQPRWAWDLKRITDQEISESVLALLMKEMKELPPDLELGLKVASCLGSRVKMNVLDILSEDVGVDLLAILQQVTERGLMKRIANDDAFCFVHDKIQQAAYELMTEQQRQKSHMQYGMTLCSYMDYNCDNNDLFFTAINQINNGGPSVVSDPNQRSILAKMNLNAGKLSIALSDYTTALSLFEHGISYLEDEKWASDYELSLNLFDAAAEAACVLNKNAAVTSYTEEIVANAKSFDDSLNCLAVTAKALRQADMMKESMLSSFDTLFKLGEQPPRDIDATLYTDMVNMNTMLRGMSDDSILNMQENKEKKIEILLALQANLAHVMHFIMPTLIGALSLRMVELTMKHGLVPASPLAFGFYGAVLITAGNIDEGCRLGRLALKLVDKKISYHHKSAVISLVYVTILWAVEPLQAIVDAHKIGRRLGQQQGDFVHMALNWCLSITTSYFAGDCLDDVQANCKDYVVTMHQQNSDVFVGLYTLVYHETRVLKQGLSAYDAKQSNIHTMAEAREKFGSNCFMFQSVHMIHKIILAYLFRMLDDLSLDSVDISGDIERKKHSLNPCFMFGLFYEGLTSFLLARQTTRDSERLKWIEKGENVLTKIKFWSEHSSWNWESKMVMLEAEKMYTMGNCNLASLYYDKAIRVAHEHKFINDEAIASELAGTFFCYQGLHVRAKALLLHSVQSYKTWGATAVAKRVEALIASKYGNEQMFNEADTTLETLQAQSCGYDVCQPALSNGQTTPELLSEEQKRSSRRKCSVPECPNRDVQGGLCISHGAKRKTCNHPGCTKSVKKAGMCSTHGPARKRCEFEGCVKVAVQGGRCIAHGAKKKVCSIEECTKQAIVGGMCKKHNHEAKGIVRVRGRPKKTAA